MFLNVGDIFLVLFLNVITAVVSHSGTSQCEKMGAMAAMKDSGTVVETSLKMLAGTWISEGCETRPGPEYILRSYTFEPDGRYFLIQHRYWDDSCSTPQLSVQSHGKIQLRNSLFQPGAASGTFRISNITVIPQDTNAAKELDRTVSMECPGQYWKSWRKYEEHTVYDSRYDENKKSKFKLWFSNAPNNPQSINSKGSNVHFSDIACLGSLKWAFNELKLLKIQLRPVGDHSRKHAREVKMELLLGDIHSNYRLRQYYNPTSFQVPLVKQVKDQTLVYLNRHSFTVKNTQALPQNIFTNTKTPPHLIEKPHLPPYIWGEWTSTRCESRPAGVYLTRRFSFYSQDETWIGEHKFFSDPFCKIPKFIVTAAGHFGFSGANKELKGTTNLDFQIEKASLTVVDQKMIYDMGLPGLCGQDEWEVDVPKELSTTGGCIQLGIILPSIQHDIVKVEMDYKGACLLFLGQVDTDNMPSEESRRPLAFQWPLVKCGEVPTFSQGLRDILNEQFYGDSGAIRICCGGMSAITWSIVVLLYNFVRSCWVYI